MPDFNFRFYIYTLTFLLLTTSCGPEAILSYIQYFTGSPTSGNAKVSVIPLKEQTDDKSSNTRANTRCEERGNDISLSSRLEEITSANASQYEISGQCDRNSGTDITISVEGAELEVQCTRSSWSETIDLTSVLEGKKEIEISVKLGDDSDCVEIENFFKCPTGFIPVPRLDPYTDRDFCVMEYEAKLEGDGDVITAPGITNRGTPWIGLSREKADLICQKLGEKKDEKNRFGYKLISNDQWQTIARKIENNGENWSLGRKTIRDGNALNTGHANRYVSNKGKWESERTSHFLTNGFKIYNLADGVPEWVRGNTSTLVNSTSDNKIGLLTSKNKDSFGPDLDYSSVFSDNPRRVNIGLGAASLNSVKTGIARGGSSARNARNAGIFTVDATLDAARVNRQVGFRCVFEDN